MGVLFNLELGEVSIVSTLMHAAYLVSRPGVLFDQVVSAAGKICRGGAIFRRQTQGTLLQFGRTGRQSAQQEEEWRG